MQDVHSMQSGFSRWAYMVHTHGLGVCLRGQVEHAACSMRNLKQLRC